MEGLRLWVVSRVGRLGCLRWAGGRAVLWEQWADDVLRLVNGRASEPGGEGIATPFEFASVTRVDGFEADAIGSSMGVVAVGARGGRMRRARSSQPLRVRSSW